jgi:hypothetical protein
MMPSIPSFSLSTTPIATSEARVNNLTRGMFNQSGLSVGAALILALAIVVGIYIAKKA